MSIRANVMFDDEVWSGLSQAPKGERSRIVNEAVAAWLQRKSLERAVKEMDAIRASMKPLGRSAEELIREDRDAHAADH